MKKGVKRIDAALIQSLPVPVNLVNRDREVVEFNEAAAPLMTTNPVGRDLTLSLRHPNLLDAVDEVIGGTGRVSGEFVIPALFAQTFQFAVVLLKEKKSTDYTRALITLNDITSIRATEEMQADFVANVSHELRSPLSTLIGFIETLRGVGWGDDEALERILGIMDAEVHRLKRLIHDLPSVPGDADELAEVFSNLIDYALEYGAENTSVMVGATPIAGCSTTAAKGSRSPSPIKGRASRGNSHRACPRGSIASTRAGSGTRAAVASASPSSSTSLTGIGGG